VSLFVHLFTIARISRARNARPTAMQTSERLTVDRTAKIALRLATCGLPRAGRAASHSARVRRFSHRID